MPKGWQDLTQSEKIEDLRRDVLRLFDAANDHLERIRALSGAIYQQNETLKKVEAELKALRSPAPKIE